MEHKAHPKGVVLMKVERAGIAYVLGLFCILNVSKKNIYVKKKKKTETKNKKESRRSIC